MRTPCCTGTEFFPPLFPPIACWRNLLPTTYSRKERDRSWDDCLSCSIPLLLVFLSKATPSLHFVDTQGANGRGRFSPNSPFFLTIHPPPSSIRRPPASGFPPPAVFPLFSLFFTFFPVLPLTYRNWSKAPTPVLFLFCSGRHIP